ncbi:MAG: LysE family translocator [Bermanella sp.]
MLPIDALLQFFATALFLGLVPGPDNIFVLMQSVLRGKAAGLMIVLGLCTGLLLHTGLVALGVAVIFQTSPWAFNALKIIGASYLVYLAVLSFKAGAEKIEGQDANPITYKKLYVRGIVMNITNPKVVVFFLAFLPQFTQPKLGLVSEQLILLGGVFILATLLVFTAIAMMAASIASGLKKSDSAQSILHKMAAAVF